jgi:propionyl-CoA synthetase
MKPGSATKAVPGYNVKILDDHAEECKVLSIIINMKQINILGKLCIKSPTPPSFALTIWNNDKAFVEKYFSEY